MASVGIVSFTDIEIGGINAVLIPEGCMDVDVDGHGDWGRDVLTAKKTTETKGLEMEIRELVKTVAVL